MKTHEEKLKSYARLVIEKGIALSAGKPVVIRTSTDAIPFARALTEEAYAHGASNVIVNISDDEITRARFLHAADETFEKVPASLVLEMKEYREMDASFIAIDSGDPDLLKPVDPKRISAASRARSTALKEHNDALMNDEFVWCVVAYADPAWAKKVFPDLPEDEAVEKLWEEIYKTTRVDKGDPVKAWEEHLAKLEEKMQFLNDARFDKLVYRASNGTDLTIRLPEGHLWLGGAGESRKGHPFVANMPTEEVFTMPHKYGVDGIVYSSKPLSLNGKLVDRFWVQFADGYVTDYDAEIGKTVLDEFFAIDDAARRLGEVALVPYHSPISLSGIIFQNTLFDENASCHLAFGQAYPTTIEGGEHFSSEELDAHGANESLVHVDFMVGTEDLSIIGVKGDQETPVFVDGDWA